MLTFTTDQLNWIDKHLAQDFLGWKQEEADYYEFSIGFAGKSYDVCWVDPKCKGQERVKYAVKDWHPTQQSAQAIDLIENCHMAIFSKYEGFDGKMIYSAIVNNSQMKEGSGEAYSIEIALGLACLASIGMEMPTMISGVGIAA